MVTRHADDTFTINTLGTKVSISTLQSLIRELNGYWPETNEETQRKKDRKEALENFDKFRARYEKHLKGIMRDYEEMERDWKKGYVSAPTPKQAAKYRGAIKELSSLDKTYVVSDLAVERNRRYRWAAKLAKTYQAPCIAF